METLLIVLNHMVILVKAGPQLSHFLLGICILVSFLLILRKIV